ncbi:hypothetical protein Hanom_Chr04g00363881 [Helianthus anomalus]
MLLLRPLFHTQKYELYAFRASDCLLKQSPVRCSTRVQSLGLTLSSPMKMLQMSSRSIFSSRPPTMLSYISIL